MKQFISIALIITIAITLSGCKIFRTAESSYNVSLEVWGVFDNADDYNEIFRAYADMHPFVKNIKFRKFTIDDYEKELNDALAAGQGPDIFMIHNSWGLDYQNKIAPAPKNIITEKQLDTEFVDVVKQDFFIDDQIYALPLSVDSLALYYNKDLFNAAAITSPPTTWEEFNDVVRKLTQIDQFGNIIQSGAAMGTAQNINRSIDILTLLMMQSGVTMSDGHRARFAQAVSQPGTQNSIIAGESALSYYTGFAQPTNSVYSWNNHQHYSIDAFTEGTVGMMVNYSWHYHTIKNKNPKLNFAVVPVPQIDPNKPKNFANYWAFAVAQNKQPVAQQGKRPVSNKVRIHEAWQLIKFMTMAKNGRFTLIHGTSGKQKQLAIKIDDPANTYLTKTQKPAARRDLIAQQQEDVVFGPFAYGNLNAHSWLRRSPAAVDSALAEMITSVVTGKTTPTKALQTAQNRVTQLLSNNTY